MTTSVVAQRVIGGQRHCGTPFTTTERRSSRRCETAKMGASSQMADTDKTGIGDRMKGQYEARAQSWLPRRTFTIIRLDGKAFHTDRKSTRLNSSHLGISYAV